MCRGDDSGEGEPGEHCLGVWTSSLGQWQQQGWVWKPGVSGVGMEAASLGWAEAGTGDQWQGGAWAFRALLHVASQGLDLARGLPCEAGNLARLSRGLKPSQALLGHRIMCAACLAHSRALV